MKNKFIMQFKIFFIYNNYVINMFDFSTFSMFS